MIVDSSITGSTETDILINSKLQLLLFVITAASGDPDGTYTLQWYSEVRGAWIDLLVLDAYIKLVECPEGRLRLSVASESGTTSWEVDGYAIGRAEAA